jgi:CheY-like chemotaxis protein
VIGKGEAVEKANGELILIVEDNYFFIALLQETLAGLGASVPGPRSFDRRLWRRDGATRSSAGAPATR